ncbi:TLC domain-containing protein 2-like isoform X2 [Alosa sapidissima]|uniref:TLC domain-containing protein 2-like isoform X2 n=1 Tax=Alosa sapidissima TaxID=34773 RepID=UPI001C082DE2|nr:TLC domain-containing protein 2-like isoform X2 [Alosa sapidissima]XP_041949622.1 TLC domain-containing protein 2-like isoform X2 [Alosa sapidissima]XP_041949623.1 TLC domain-containing protein 2-like isoform X2 [Alosa sapidissima]
MTSWTMSSTRSSVQAGKSYVTISWSRALCHKLQITHRTVVTCFSIAVLTRQYVGFAVVALLVEINSVFLHGRQLLRMSGRAASSGALCRLNSVLNLGTFVAFRISTLAWMTRWLALNRTRVLLPLYAVGSVGLLAIMVMNAVLFYRLLRSDFLQAGREGTRKEK